MYSIVRLFLEYMAKLNSDQQYKIISIVDHGGVNSFILMCRSGEVRWIEKIFKMIPQGKLWSVCVPDANNDRYYSSQSVFTSVVESTNQGAFKFVMDFLPILEKESASYPNLNDYLKHCIKEALYTAEELGLSRGAGIYEGFGDFVGELKSCMKSLEPGWEEVD